MQVSRRCRPGIVPSSRQNGLAWVPDRKGWRVGFRRRARAIRTYRPRSARLLRGGRPAARRARPTRRPRRDARSSAATTAPRSRGAAAARRPTSRSVARSTTGRPSRARRTASRRPRRTTSGERGRSRARPSTSLEPGEPVTTPRSGRADDASRQLPEPDIEPDWPRRRRRPLRPPSRRAEAPRAAARSRCRTGPSRRRARSRASSSATTTPTPARRRPRRVGVGSRQTPGSASSASDWAEGDFADVEALKDDSFEVGALPRPSPSSTTTPSSRRRSPPAGAASARPRRPRPTAATVRRRPPAARGAPAARADRARAGRHDAGPAGQRLRRRWRRPRPHHPGPHRRRDRGGRAHHVQARPGPGRVPGRDRRRRSPPFELYEAFRARRATTRPRSWACSAPMAIVGIAYTTLRPRRVPAGHRARRRVHDALVHGRGRARPGPVINIADHAVRVRLRRRARRVRRPAARRRPTAPASCSAIAICAVGYDVFGYFVGSQFGRSRLAPRLSPNKTWEGLFGGMVASLIARRGSCRRSSTPWDDSLTDGLALGLVVAIVAPLGDLCESMIKRDLGVKDLGTHPPGPRRGPRPLRRDPVLPAGRLLPRRPARDRVTPRSTRPSRSCCSARPDRSAPRPSTSSPAAGGRYEVVALAGGTQHRAARTAAARDVRASPPTARRSCVDDPDALAELAALPEADVVLNAVVGLRRAAGHARRARARQAPRAGQQGEPHRRRARRRRAPGPRGGGEIVPVDSEHSAVYQALRAGTPRRGRADHPHRERRPVPGPDPRRARARDRRRRAARTPPGTWAPRSRSTRRRS